MIIKNIIKATMVCFKILRKTELIFNTCRDEETKSRKSSTCKTSNTFLYKASFKTTKHRLNKKKCQNAKLKKLKYISGSF